MEITTLLITVFLLGAIAIWFRVKYDKEFYQWFEEVCNQAIHYGFTLQDIENFVEEDWRTYYWEDLSPEEAIKQKLSEK